MFLHPWFLLLLPLVPMMGWRMWQSSRSDSISFSSVVSDWDLRPSWPARMLWLPPAMTLCALTLMIVSLARPRFGREQTVVHSEGIAIEMVVDRSSSMRALDFKIEGRHVDRLQAIKNVAKKFVLGEQNDSAALTGRLSDLIGLVVFAGHADAVTPPTLDHSFLISQLNETEITVRRSEDGTAIGDAIALAVDKLNSLDSRQQEKVKSKVVILLTDGENTAGEMEPLQAAELAKAMEIKVYTIGVGTKGLAPFPVGRDRNGRVVVDEIEVNIDEKTLRGIAKETGGKYFRATDTDSLESIYDAIDKLEKTKVEAQQLVDYKEIAIQPWRIGGIGFPPLLVVAMLLLAIGQILRHTVFRQAHQFASHFRDSQRS